MALNTRPLSDTFGLEILDVDLAELDQSTFDAIYAEWQREPLLLFRRQSLTEGTLVDYSRGFGDLDLIVRDDMHSPTHPEIIYITGLRRPDGTALGGLGTDEVHWHHDQIYRERPASGSIFYAVEVPEQGGCTSWCNTVMGLNALPNNLREQLDGRTATCKYGLKAQASFQRDFAEASHKARIDELHRRTPAATHPVVLTNPTTGERSLYLDPNKTIALNGVSEAETRPLLDEVFQYVLRDEHIYTHQWRNGDVVMWDNARLMHRREAFDETLPRLAKRTTIFLRPRDFAVPEPHLGA
ncbi:MAG: TauD/TfdA family dioxygenase [Pseudomonadota bacterium]